MNISTALLAAFIFLSGSIITTSEIKEYSLAEAIKKDVIRAKFLGNENSTHYLKPIVSNLENRTNKKIVIRKCNK